jgi:hypothetical protein
MGRCYGSGGGGIGAGSFAESGGGEDLGCPVLLAASAAIAIARSAASPVASGGTTSSATRAWKALVTPIMCGSIWRNQPTRTRRPSTATRRGAPSQASRLAATRVIGPSEVLGP